MLAKIATRICSAAFFSLVVAWCIGAEGGMSLDASGSFSWHAIGMTIAFPCFMSESVMAIRGGQTTWHIAANIIAILCCIPSLASIVYYKSLILSSPLSDYQMLMDPGMSMDMGMGMVVESSYNSTATANTMSAFPFYTMFSVHSWCGVTTLTLMTSQIVTGILRNKYDMKLRAIHRTIGKATFVCGLATCALGLADMQSSDLAGNGYPPHSTYSLMAAGASVVLVPLGIMAFST